MRARRIVGEDEILQGERIGLGGKRLRLGWFRGGAAGQGLPAVEVVLVGAEVGPGERHTKGHFAVELASGRRRAGRGSGRGSGRLHGEVAMRGLAGLHVEGQAGAGGRRGRLGIIGSGVGVGISKALVDGRGVVFEKREFSIAEKGVHVSAEFASMVVDTGELEVRALGVVVGRGREAEFNGFVEFLRRGKVHA